MQIHTYDKFEKKRQKLVSFLINVSTHLRTSSGFKFPSFLDKID